MIDPLFSVAAVVGQGSGWIGEWAPGIGDPTPFGWMTTVVYVLAAGTCWGAWTLKSPLTSERRLWLVLAVVVTALGINHLLDLQTAFTEVWRLLAYDEGWYPIRRPYQGGSILAVLLGVAAVLGGLFWLTRGLPRATKVAAVGTVLVLGYVIIRAVSFHDVDRLINSSVAGVSVDGWIELGGLTVVLVGSVARLRSRGSRP